MDGNLFRTYRASNDKKDDVAPASNNLSSVHKAILETQKKFKEQEQERKQMEVGSMLFFLNIKSNFLLFFPL